MASQSKNKPSIMVIPCIWDGEQRDVWIAEGQENNKWVKVATTDYAGRTIKGTAEAGVRLAAYGWPIDPNVFVFFPNDDEYEFIKQTMDSMKTGRRRSTRKRAA